MNQFFLIALSFVALACTPSMDDIHKKVSDDSVKSYELAVKGGDKMEICVQAGMVAAAYNQAHDEANYLSWKKKEKEDCEAAGIMK